MNRVLAGLLFWLLSVGLASAAMTGDDVHSWCESNRSMALAYASGIADHSARVSYTLDISVRMPPDSRLKTFSDVTLDLAKDLLVGYCIPDQATMEQITDVFCSFLKDTPKDRNLPATSLFQSAMRKAWPCGKNITR